MKKLATGREWIAGAASRLGLALVALATWMGHLEAQASPESVVPSEVTTTAGAIREADLAVHVNYLASEPLAGRLTGTPAEELATNYIAGQLQRFGLEPAGADGSYFQSFTVVSGVDLGTGNRLSWCCDAAGTAGEGTLGEEFMPLSFSAAGGRVEGSIAFAGYGLVVPASADYPAHNSFADQDVAGKWVMILRFVPEELPPAHRQHLFLHAELQRKVAHARGLGALGVLVVSGPSSRVDEQLVPLDDSAARNRSGIPAISITDAVADQMLSTAGQSLESLQRSLDRGESVPGFTLDPLTLQAEVDLIRRESLARNVLARLPADPPAAGAAAVCIGAHHDHLGTVTSTTRDAMVGGDAPGTERENAAWFPGADDNASGVAALLELAEYLAAEKVLGRLSLSRDLLFATWSGEEPGNLGSTHYLKSRAEATGAPLAREIAAYLNLDMVGRWRESLEVTSTGSSPVWPSMVTETAEALDLRVALTADPYQPTDSTAFYFRGVPVLSFTTGVHQDQHRPTDTPDKLNLAGLVQVTRLADQLVRRLALATEPPAFASVPRPTGGHGFRVRLGIVPDFSVRDVEGLVVGAVIEGGPAQAAGLQAGDIIVTVGTTPVANIYEYSTALGGLRVGEDTQVVVLRGGERLLFTVVPMSAV